MKVDYSDIFLCGLFLVMADTSTGAGLAIAGYAIGCAVAGALLRWLDPTRHPIQEP